jgi:hypothetical protein
MKLTSLILFIPNTLELITCTPTFYYVIAVGHFRPVARHSCTFACQYARHAMTPLTDELNPGDQLIIKRENLTYSYEFFFLLYRYYTHLLFTKFPTNVITICGTKSLQLSLKLYQYKALARFHVSNSHIRNSCYQEPSTVYECRIF